jgi:hypothetical protein
LVGKIGEVRAKGENSLGIRPELSLREGREP